MNDHATLNANILAAAKEALRGAQARQDRRGVDVLDTWILSQEYQGPETRKVLWSRAMDMAFNLGEEECEAGYEQADVPALLQDVPVLIKAWRGGLKFHKKSSGSWCWPPPRSNQPYNRSRFICLSPSTRILEARSAR